MSGDLVLNLDMWPQKMTANVSFPHGDRFEGGKFISKRGGYRKKTGKFYPLFGSFFSLV